jgi:GntR family transcriptional regulator / MocR family aminotransferase
MRKDRESQAQMQNAVDIHIRLSRRGELTSQIYRQLLDAVLDGRLRPGERLPSTRELARGLDVARNTVGVAYELLASEGVLVGRVGAGSFISAAPLRPAVRPVRAPAGAVYPRNVWRSLRVPFHRPSGTAAYDFTVGTPDAALFPFTTWRRLLAREFCSSPAQCARYGHPAGHAGLRSAIARHVSVSRAVRADAEDVIVTHGAQQALDLIGRVLISEGTCVAVEEPGYPYARLLFHSLGARVVGVPVDQDGINVDVIPRMARLVYVTPSHQFPLGVGMSLQRRTALLAWAEKHGAVIIEDDYDTEFRLGDRPLDPLQSLDRTGRVIYVGTFSKVLLPTLRVGFLIAPATLQPALQAAKHLTDWHGDLATQAALARFIDEGLLTRHVRRVAREYADRYAQIVDAFDHRFSDHLRPIQAAAGIHVAAEVVSEQDADMAEVVRRAEERGVRVGTLSEFCFETPVRSGLVLGYGAIQSSRVKEGMTRLASCFDHRKTPVPRRLAAE